MVLYRQMKIEKCHKSGRRNVWKTAEWRYLSVFFFFNYRHRTLPPEKLLPLNTVLKYNNIIIGDTYGKTKTAADWIRRHRCDKRNWTGTTAQDTATLRTGTVRARLRHKIWSRFWRDDDTRSLPPPEELINIAFYTFIFNIFTYTRFV